MNDERVQPEGTQVTSVQPDIEGCAGVAWVVDLKKVRQQRENGTDTKAARTAKAAVAAWIIDSRWADEKHPYSLVGVTDLAFPNRDGSPPTIRVPGATHELFVSPLPSWYVPVIDDITPLRADGPSFVGQFVARGGHAEAAAMVRDDVRDICNALLLPTDDGYPQWKHRYGDAMLEHGEHTEVKIESFVIDDDGELKPITNSMSDKMREAVIRAVAARRGKGASLDGEFAIPDEATVTPGCDCPTCELIREVRKSQGRDVIAHDGSIEVPAPDAVRH